MSRMIVPRMIVTRKKGTSEANKICTTLQNSHFWSVHLPARLFPSNKGLSVVIFHPEGYLHSPLWSKSGQSRWCIFLSLAPGGGPHLEPAAIRRCVLTRVNITSPPSALPVIKFHSADGNHWGGGRTAAELASNKWLQM